MHNLHHNTHFTIVKIWDNLTLTKINARDRVDVHLNTGSSTPVNQAVKLAASRMGVLWLPLGKIYSYGETPFAPLSLRSLLSLSLFFFNMPPHHPVILMTIFHLLLCLFEIVILKYLF